MAKHKRGRPKLRVAERKMAWVQLRVQDSEKQVYEKAADATGEKLSAMTRRLLRQECNRVLQGRPVPFPDEK